ncbi:replication-relaxation family protein [Pseudonocardia sp. CA-107938]|uniref:replication-relaxation family protein n=1 Tax=Pseudonocardia sp. CA-107938 TaxID=3240021 RepID=UPI003D91730D
MLLELLADHRVLTTEQIATVAFGSVRRAQDRLRVLRELGVVFGTRRSAIPSDQHRKSEPGARRRSRCSAARSCRWTRADELSGNPTAYLACVAQ